MTDDRHYLGSRKAAQAGEEMSLGTEQAALSSQVSWYWKSLAELDQLWMLKCLRFNWYISFSPTPFEQGVWKKHYIQMVRELHVTKPKASLRQRAAHSETGVGSRF